MPNPPARSDTASTAHPMTREQFIASLEAFRADGC